MCGLTALFGLSAYAYLINTTIGFVVMSIILFGVELFIEKSAMINEKYNPLMGLMRRIKRLFAAVFKRKNQTNSV
jgi:UDP-GlcNAc:undecaprenyl-phosphate GlcNAc-1-phosphate transferase